MRTEESHFLEPRFDLIVCVYTFFSEKKIAIHQHLTVVCALCGNGNVTVHT